MATYTGDATITRVDTVSGDITRNSAAGDSTINFYTVPAGRFCEITLISYSGLEAVAGGARGAYGYIGEMLVFYTTGAAASGARAWDDGAIPVLLDEGQSLTLRLFNLGAGTEYSRMTCIIKEFNKP